jgi:hypothetical protein
LWWLFVELFWFDHGPYLIVLPLKSFDFSCDNARTSWLFL